jgi:hypothetical protein
VKATSLFWDGSRSIRSPRDQRTLKAGFGSMAQGIENVIVLSCHRESRLLEKDRQPTRQIIIYLVDWSPLDAE